MSAVRTPVVTRARGLAAAAPLLAFAVYAGTLRHPFVFYDVRGIVENTSIHHLGDLHYVLVGSRRPLVNHA